MPPRRKTRVTRQTTQIRKRFRAENQRVDSLASAYDSERFTFRENGRKKRVVESLQQRPTIVACHGSSCTT
ncbi:hypothetical protein MPLB_1280013 [Mesorhizobium sp. ORS 3324]|nr:hypothetical protein MPLB_1280013 [Mesorhizobium sp. ORS 3324]